MAKKYYWLKLQKDFFKNHHVKIIENMTNGTDYILFYMKLLVESISHEGRLRFSDRVPYNDDMLATITGTNIDIVRSAVKIFTELELMTMEDDGTIFMVETAKMMGTETEWAEKKRLYRDSQKGQKRTLSDKSKSLELEKDIEKDIDKKRKYNPADDLVFFNDDDFQIVWKDYLEVRTKKKASKSDRAIKTIIDSLKTYSSNDKNTAIKIIAKSADSGWTGIFAMKDSTGGTKEIKTETNQEYFDRLARETGYYDKQD